MGIDTISDPGFFMKVTEKYRRINRTLFRFPAMIFFRNIHGTNFNLVLKFRDIPALQKLMIDMSRRSAYMEFLNNFGKFIKNISGWFWKIVPPLIIFEGKELHQYHMEKRYWKFLQRMQKWIFDGRQTNSFLLKSGIIGSLSFPLIKHTNNEISLIKSTISPYTDVGNMIVNRSSVSSMSRDIIRGVKEDNSPVQTERGISAVLQNPGAHIPSNFQSKFSIRVNNTNISDDPRNMFTYLSGRHLFDRYSISFTDLPVTGYQYRNIPQTSDLQKSYSFNDLSYQDIDKTAPSSLFFNNPGKMDDKIEQIKKIVQEVKNTMNLKTVPATSTGSTKDPGRIDVNRISDQVYQMIDMKLRIEKERRGYL